MTDTNNNTAKKKCQLPPEETKSPENKVLSEALRLIDLGYRPVPTRPGEKFPAIKWKQYQNEIPTAQQWEQWTDRFPGCGVGIVTTDLVIIDVDTLPDGSRNHFLDQPIVKEMLEANPHAVTPSGGRHIFFRQGKRTIRNSASELFQNVDIRADGGFLVVYPTERADGKYNWVGALLDKRPEDLNELPAKIIDRLCGPAGEEFIKPHRDSGDHHTTHLSGRPIPEGTEDAFLLANTDPEDIIPQAGNRDDTIFRAACKVNKHNGVTGDALKQYIVEFNSKCLDAMGDPAPLPMDQLKKIYRSVMGYEAERVTPAEGHDQRPRIVTNGREARLVIADYWRAIEDQVFVLADQLVKISKDETGERTSFVTADRLYLMLNEAAEIVKMDGRNHTFRPDEPNIRMVKAMASNPPASIRRLTKLARTPFFDKTGRLVIKAGYDEKSKVYLSLGNDLEGISISDHITGRQAMSAFKYITDEVLAEFPFAKISDQAGFWAALFTSFVRPMIDGPTPIFMFEASRPGSGKTLLASVIATIVSGSKWSMAAKPKQDQEMQKMITSKLMTAPDLIFVDNVTSMFSGGLAAMMTAAGGWEDRRLQVSEMMTTKIENLWLITSNNPGISEELARRSVRIRLQPDVSNPFEQTGFRHDNLIAWALKNRLNLVRAVLTMIKFGLQSGQKSTAVMGSFESWVKISGSILAGIGISDFMGDREEFFSKANVDGDEFDEFCAAWLRLNDGAEMNTAALVNLCEREDLLVGPLSRSKGTARADQNTLAYYLRKKRGVVVNGRRFEFSKDSHTKCAVYSLSEI